MPRSHEQSFRQLTRRYVWSLVLIAATVVGGLLYHQLEIKVSFRDPGLMNYAGRQRARSQKMAKLILMLENGSGYKAPADIVEELRSTFESWTETQEVLKSGKDLNGMEVSRTVEADAILEEASNSFQVMSKAVKAILDLSRKYNPEGHPQFFIQADTHFDAYMNAESEYLGNMEKLLNHYEKENVSYLQRVRGLELGYLFFLLILTGLCYFLLIRPVIKRVRIQMDSIEDSNTRIDHLNGELHTSNVMLQQRAEELRDALERAESGTRAKSRFLAGMSHEIRTPLNAVIGMTGLLVETELSQEQRYFAQAIKSAGDSLLALINDILDFSKIEAGKLTLERVHFDLETGLVDEMMEFMAVLSERKSIELTYYISPDVPRQLNGDPARLRQVMVNLLGNAIKFTQKGTISLKITPAEKSGNEVTLLFEVSDTGSGISPSTQMRLFKPFEQGAPNLASSIPGTGLGLAISRQLVEKMGGTIDVESTLGVGSKFYFTAKFELVEFGVPAPDTSVLKGKRVLIVDDNQLNREFLEYLCRNVGMEFVSVDSAEAALRVVDTEMRSSGRFQVALLDYHLPGMNGLQLAELLRDHDVTRKAVLVMLTSVSNLHHFRESRPTINTYLVKPVRHGKILQSLLQFFDTQETDQEPSDMFFVPEEVVAVLDEGHFTRSLKILVVEDNPVNQMITRKQLEKLGHHVEIAGNGIEAVQSVERIHFDLVFMDCQMPEMDGLEATRIIRRRESRERRSRLPIVAMTAGATTEERQESMTAGMDGFVSKPVSKEALIATLRKFTAAAPA